MSSTYYSIIYGIKTVLDKPLNIDPKLSIQRIDLATKNKIFQRCIKNPTMMIHSNLGFQCIKSFEYALVFDQSSISNDQFICDVEELITSLRIYTDVPIGISNAIHLIDKDGINSGYVINPIKGSLHYPDITNIGSLSEINLEEIQIWIKKIKKSKKSKLSNALEYFNSAYQGNNTFLNSIIALESSVLFGVSVELKTNLKIRCIYLLSQCSYSHLEGASEILSASYDLRSEIVHNGFNPNDLFSKNKIPKVMKKIKSVLERFNIYTLESLNNRLLDISKTCIRKIIDDIDLFPEPNPLEGYFKKVDKEIVNKISMDPNKD